jgi:hypothetical protein
LPCANSKIPEVSEGNPKSKTSAVFTPVPFHLSHQRITVFKPFSDDRFGNRKPGTGFSQFPGFPIAPACARSNQDPHPDTGIYIPAQYRRSDLLNLPIFRGAVITLSGIFKDPEVPFGNFT